LVRLNLFYNRLAGKIVKFVGDLSSLDVLQLCENNFTGGILAKLDEVMTKREDHRCEHKQADRRAAWRSLRWRTDADVHCVGQLDVRHHPWRACRVTDGDPAGWELPQRDGASKVVYTVEPHAHWEFHNNLLLGKLQLDGDMMPPSIGELSMYNIRLSGNVSRVVYKGTMMRGGAVVAVKRLLSIGVGRVHDYYEL
jgi:hypothetical protein